MSGVDTHSIEVLLRHSEWARRLARRLVEEGSADDAVQEVWLTALTRESTPLANPQGWLARVLRRTAGHLGRGERRREARERLAARLERQPSTLEIVERFSTQKVVAEAVLALAPPDRDILLQRFYMDLSLRELAAREDVPITTMQERITRALRRLRRDLEGRLGVRGERFVLALAPFLGWGRRGPRAVRPAAKAIVSVGVAATLTAVLPRLG